MKASLKAPLKSLHNQQGFTLTELMVAAGLAMLILNGMFLLHTNMLKSQVSSTNNMEVADLRYEVAGVLAQVDKCTGILGGKASTAGTGLTVSSNITTGALYGKLTLTSVALQNIKVFSADKRSANIELVGTKSGSGNVTNTFTELVNVYYSVNSNNVIVTCKDNVSVCSFLGGVWKIDHCDFCGNLGGTVNPDGTCAPAP